MKTSYFLISIAIVTIFFMIELFNPFLKSITVAILLTIATSTLTIYLEKRISSRALATSIITIGLAALFSYLFYIVFFHLQISLTKWSNKL